MFESAAAYLVAIFAMSLAGLTALTLFYVINHLDPTGSSSLQDRHQDLHKDAEEHAYQEVTV